MSIVNGYCTLPEFKQYAQDQGFTGDDSYYEDVVTDVSRWIDNYCQRHFWQDVDATRTFEVNGCSLDLGPFGDLVEVTSISTDDAGDGTYSTTWADTDYQLWPFNSLAAPEAQPYTKILTTGSRSFPVIYGRSNVVQIEGTFGWPAVPRAVRRACLIQASRICKRRYSPEGVAGFGEFGAVRVEGLDSDVASMLAPYRYAGGIGIA